MTRPTLNRVLAGTLVLPTIFGALVLWSLSDRVQQSHRVPTAVVNLDKPVTTGTGPNRHIVAAGRLLAAGLTSPRRTTDRTLGWQLTDQQHAQAGLHDGGYYAVVTIPRGFSRTIAGINGKHPSPAGVLLQTNDSSSALVGRASRQVTDLAAARLGHRITSTYLSGVYAKTGALKGRVGQAAAGAGRVADGVGAVRSGADRLGSGADRLAGGLGRLSSGAGRLAGGADRLSHGSAALHAGTGRLADGASRLDAGTARLARGLGLLAGHTRGLPAQTNRLADGAGKVAGGVGPYTKLVKAWEQACLTDPAVSGTEARLCAATVRAAGPDGGTADKLAAGSRRLEAGTRRLADAAPRLTAGIGRAASGARRLEHGTHQLAGGAHRLDVGTARLATGSSRLSTGAGQIATGAGRAGTGASRLAAGSSRLADGSSRLHAGSQRLASGLAKGAAQIPDQAGSARQARVVADPVSTRASDLNPAADGATLLVPAVLALALWLGAFATYLVRPALPARRLRGAASGWRVTLGGWGPAVLIGVAQAALLFTAVLLLGARLADPAAVALLTLPAAAVFAAVNQAFVAWFGPRRGWIVSIGFAVLQLVSLGGLIPVDTAPGPLQALNAVLPLGRAADAFTGLGLGGQVGSPVADVVVLLLWGGAGLAVTTLAARRRQRVSLDDVRREVARRPA